MPITNSLLVLALALVTLFGGTAFGQDPPINEWVDGPDQHLPGWDVKVQPPILTFALRQAVTLEARGDVNKSGLAGHQLVTFLKVGASDHWFPGFRRSVVTEIPKSVDLSVIENFYAKPGSYRIAMVLYDPVSQRRGVWHTSVQVPERKDLPDFPDAPQIQFIDAEDPMHHHASPTPTALGNSGPLELDLILNLTERSELEIRDPEQDVVRVRNPRVVTGQSTLSIVTGPTPDWFLGRSRQDVVTQSILSIASAISALNFNGCIRVSAIDAAKGKVLLDRSEKFDPAAVFATLREKRNVNQIDLHALAARQNAATFIGKFLQRTIAERHRCSDADSEPERAIVMLSDELAFPENSSIVPSKPDPREGPPVRFFFLRMTIPEFRGFYTIPFPGQGSPRFIPTASGHQDHMGRFFKELDVRRFDLAQPKDLQRTLPQLIDELRQLANKKPGEKKS